MNQIRIVFFLLYTVSLFAVESREQAIFSVRDALVTQFGSIKLSPVSTGILHDFTIPIANIDKLDGSANAPAVDFDRWSQSVYELRQTSLSESSLPDYTHWQVVKQTAAKTHIHPILILDYAFNRIKSGITRDSIFTGENGIIRLRDNVIEESSVFAFSLAYDKTYRGANTVFNFDVNQFYFTNRLRIIENIRLDFDDGLGLRDLNSPSEVVVHYQSVGVKKLRLIIEYSTGDIASAEAFFTVITLLAPDPSQTWNLTAGQPYNGQAATGEAYILLADGHTEVTRPIVVTDGFDIGNTMFWDELYELLNQENLIEDVRALGYDAVVLNYGDGTTYIQRNAYLFETLIDSIEQIIDETQTYAVIGPSMGGLITRYALARLEQNNIPHRVRTWISFDSPHRGANIPLGAQYWVNFFADQAAEAAMLRDALNSPAARQMLLLHFTVPATANPTSDPLRQTLLNDFTNVGMYPSQPRIVSIINGSGAMQGMTFSPGAQIVQWVYDSWYIDIRGNIWALNNAASQLIFQGEINIIWPFPDEFQNVTVNPTSPWDNAPGGTSNSMEQMGNVPAPYGDIIALHNDHCFIPTISSLDLNVTNPFYNIAEEPDIYALTPFDSLYFPQANQEHVLITPESYNWFMNEVLEPLASPEVVIVAESTLVTLSWPPIFGAEEYHIYSTGDATIWPVTYQTVSDTFWTETVLDSMNFYRVEAARTIPVSNVAVDISLR